MFPNFLKNHKFTIVLVLVVLVVVGYGGWKWYGIKTNLVEQGLADPKFPYHEYSLLELMRIRPGGDLNDEMRAEFEKQLKNLPTRTTPQETFDKYIQALKDGDVEGAVSYMAEESRESERRFLNGAKEEGKWKEIIEISENINSKILWNSERIEKNRPSNKTEVDYKHPCVSVYKTGECGLGFEKDLYGDWKISGF